MKNFIFILLFLSAYPTAALAHPEFQRYSKEISGRPINCSMCHLHPDGPEGLKPGQIGSLSADELNTLGLARQAFQPGSTIKNPILNEFGNRMLNELGKEKILALKQNPALLAQAMTAPGDLDGDGIDDVEEFLDGTNPLNSLDGHPWKLFNNNLRTNIFHIIMMILATAFGMFGLHNLLLWASRKANRKE